MPTVPGGQVSFLQRGFEKLEVKPGVLEPGSESVQRAHGDVRLEELFERDATAISLALIDFPEFDHEFRANSFDCPIAGTADFTHGFLPLMLLV